MCLWGDCTSFCTISSFAFILAYIISYLNTSRLRLRCLVASPFYNNKCYWSSRVLSVALQKRLCVSSTRIKQVLQTYLAKHKPTGLFTQHESRVQHDATTVLGRLKPGCTANFVTISVPATGLGLPTFKYFYYENEKGQSATLGALPTH